MASEVIRKALDAKIDCTPSLKGVTMDLCLETVSDQELPCLMEIPMLYSKEVLYTNLQRVISTKALRVK